MSFKARSIPTLIFIVLPAVSIIASVFLSPDFYIYLSNKLHFPFESPLPYLFQIQINHENLSQTIYLNKTSFIVSTTTSLPFGFFDIMSNNETQPNSHDLGVIQIQGRSDLILLRSNTLFLILFLAYALYPLRYRGEGYFIKRNFNSIIYEYEFIKKILCIQIPLLLIVSSAIYIFNLRIDFLAFNILYLITSVLFYSVIAGLIWLSYHLLRRDFYYYLAKANLKKISENRQEADRIYYLVEGLNAYNKYISKIFKLQFNDLKIFSRIISDFNVDKYGFLKDLCYAFDDCNKLSPLKTLSSIAGTSTDELLVKGSLAEKIRTWVTFAIAIIPVIISLLQLLFSKSLTTSNGNQ